MSFTQLAPELIGMILEELTMILPGPDPIMGESGLPADESEHVPLGVTTYYLERDYWRKKCATQKDLSSFCKTCWRFFHIGYKRLYLREQDELNGFGLQWAAYHGRVETLKRANQAGAHVERWCFKLLHYACIEGHVETARYLLSFEIIDAWDLDFEGWSPLTLAARSYSLPLVHLLLKHDGENWHTQRKMPPVAMAMDSISDIGQYPRRSLKFTTKPNPEGPASASTRVIVKTPNWNYPEYEFPSPRALQRLKLAREYDSRPHSWRFNERAVDMVRFLAGRYIQVNNDKMLYTMVHLAVEAGFPDIAKDILRNTTSTSGNDVGYALKWEAARRTRNFALMDLILDHFPANKPHDEFLSTIIYHLASDRLMGLARHLLDKGADPDGRVNGRRPLAVAAQVGHVRMVALLLSRGVDLSPCENDALSLADYKEHWGVASMLLQYGHRYTVQPWHDGATILHRAALACHPDLFAQIADAVLMQDSVDVNQQDHLGATALHFAAAGQMPTNMQTLLHHGAHVNMRDIAGHTPLSVAVRYNRVDNVVTMLARRDLRFNCGELFGQMGNTPPIGFLEPSMFACLREHAAQLNIRWPQEYDDLMQLP